MFKITPSAIPVSAQCPKASEKNDILLLTIMVPMSPNRGVINKIATKAFFMKLNSTHENGKIFSSNKYIKSMFHPFRQARSRTFRAPCGFSKDPERNRFQ